MTSEFVGYDRLTHTSKISVLTTESEIVEAITEGQNGTIFVDEIRFMRRWVVRKVIQVSSVLRMQNLL